MNLPDFLIIGAQKAGTSWLYRSLRQSPSIWLPPVKELNFFNRIGQEGALPPRALSNLAERTSRKLGEPNVKPRMVRYLTAMMRFPKADLGFYNHAFSWPTAPGVLKGEATPAYLEMTEDQVSVARKILGDGMRIIVVAREPLERELSQIRMWAQRNKAEGNEVSSIDDWHRMYDWVLTNEPCGDYKTGIPRWQKHFGLENVLVVPFGLVKDDPMSLIREVEIFLGIQPFDGYTKITAPLHVTEKVEVPAEIVDRAIAKVEGQRDYLVRAYGQDFVDRTK